MSSDTPRIEEYPSSEQPQAVGRQGRKPRTLKLDFKVEHMDANATKRFHCALNVAVRAMLDRDKVQQKGMP